MLIYSKVYNIDSFRARYKAGQLQKKWELHQLG